MDKFIDIFLQDPFKAISIFAVILVGWFIKREHASRDKQFENFQNQMEAWKRQVSDISDDFVRTAREHQEFVGTSVVEMNDQFRKAFSHMNLKLDEMKKFIDQLDDGSKKAASAISSAIGSFQEEFGKITDVQKKIEDTYGKVILLEAAQEAQSQGILKHREQIGRIAAYLERQRQKDLDKEKK